MIASLPLQEILWTLAALTLAASAWLLTAYRGRVRSVGTAILRQTAEPCNPDPRPVAPGASIVVVAGSDANALEQLLQRLFEQDYQGDMEVIVVNDGKSDEVKDVVSRIKHLERRPNLYLTFTPAGMRNVSHRKLSLTLGIKAAKYPVIIALTEQSRMYSTEWLSRMVQPFTRPGVEVAIGSALPGAKFDSGRGRRYRSFTHAADAVAWLSAALRGKAWRAHRANMAFTRDVFFRSGGFNGALNLRDGDDDIFISKIATPTNTAVVCAAQAAVRYARPSSRYEFAQTRPARYYSSRSLGRSRFFGFSSLMAWVLTVAGIAGAALAVYMKEWILAGGIAALLIAAVIVSSATWRRTLKALRCRPAAIMVWPMMLRRPFTDLFHRLRTRSHRAEYHNI